jgi:hypothetical protein
MQGISVPRNLETKTSRLEEPTIEKYGISRPKRRKHGEKKMTGTLDTYDSDHRWLYYSRRENNLINGRPEVIETPDDDRQSGIDDFV